MRTLTLSALAFTIAVISGCGPKGENGSNGGGDGNPAQVKVRLAFFPNVTHGVALVGTGNGAFARSLGAIEELTFNAGPAEIEALFAGQVDIGYIGPGPAINGFLKSRGKALRIIAGASSGGAGLVVRADSGITDVKGLVGKRVASPQTGGTQDISLRHAMQQAGLESTDRGGNVIVLPTANPDTLTLFKKKELDAAWVPEPWIARLVKEGNGKVLIDERDLWPGKKFATTVVIAREEFAKGHPELVAAFLKAHVQTVEWIQNHPDDAKRLIGARIKALTQKSIPEDVLSAALSRTDFTTDPLSETVLTFADWARALRFQRDDRTSLADLFDLKPLNAALTERGHVAVK